MARHVPDEVVFAHCSIYKLLLNIHIYGQIIKFAQNDVFRAHLHFYFSYVSKLTLIRIWKVKLIKNSTFWC